MRVLGVVRLSRSSDASTSVQGQREAIERWAGSLGHEIVGWAEDEDVSGDVAPWQRPSLGQWLPATLGNRGASQREQRRALAASRAQEWDAICAIHLDRLSRRASDLHVLVDWCMSQGRAVIDLSNHGADMAGTAGTITVGVLAALAQGERERMRERAKASFARLSRTDRWRGGVVPWGYRVIDGDDGHKRLAVDPDQAALIRSLVERVKAGESSNSICRDLNARGIPTPTGRGEWRVGNLQRALKSDRLLGYMVRTDRSPGAGRAEYLVRGEDGLPIRRADPIVTRADLEAVRQQLATNSRGGGRRLGVRPDHALLLRVLWCGLCAREGRREPMYTLIGGNGKRYYRCGLRARAGITCPSGTIGADEVEALIVEGFLRTFGQTPVIDHVWHEGTDRAAEELHEIEEALANMRADRAAGLYRGDKGTAEYRATYTSLEQRREQLEAQPADPSRWVEVDTGRTFRDLWEECRDDQERNGLLRKSGIDFLAMPAKYRGQPVRERVEVGVHLDEDTSEGLRQDLTSGGSPRGAALAAGREAVRARLKE